MPARRRWWHQLQASKDEVRLAVDLYNRVGQERQLEAFVVHMSIGWLKMLQARYEKDGGRRALYELDARGRRQRTRQGDGVMKPLSALLGETYADNDPIRHNVEFFLGLRHKIEHRYDRDIASLVVGKTQALVLNYERELVEHFGAGDGLANELRIPIFLSRITEDAVEALQEIRTRVPRAVLDYVQDYDAALDPEIAGDDAYDFRVYLIPKLGPKTEADIAMTFVRLEELAPEQRDEVEKAMMIIREKQVPVSNLDALLPGQVVERVREALNIKFTQTDHTRCWQHYEGRPPGDSDIPSAPSRSSAIGTAPSNGTFTRTGGSTTSRASWPTPTSIARFSAATADRHESAHSRQARRPLTGVVHTSTRTRRSASRGPPRHEQPSRPHGGAGREAII